MVCLSDHWTEMWRQHQQAAASSEQRSGGDQRGYGHSGFVAQRIVADVILQQRMAVWRVYNDSFMYANAVEPEANFTRHAYAHLL